MSFDVVEQYGSRSRTRRRVRVDRNRTVSLGDRSKALSSQSLANLFCDLFLPQGYPESVSEDYLEYQCWDSVQAFASSMTGALATEAALKGAGVGDQTATALAAALVAMASQAAGMAGRIAFGWLRGSQLDSDCKTWRLVADVLNDAAMCVHLLLPYWPAAYAYGACVSSLLLAVVGIAGGATRTALTQHQARRNNLADVAAKDGSQETLVNLSALVCGVVLLPAVSGKHALVWTLFAIFTAVHLFANYRAIRACRIDTLNLKRLRLLVREYLHSRRILPVAQANEREPLLSSLVGASEPFGQFGCSFEQARQSSAVESLLADKFVVQRSVDGHLRVMLRTDGADVDMLEAAFCVDVLLSNSASDRSQQSRFEDGRKLFRSFLDDLKTSDWNLKYVQLNYDEWRYEMTR